ncbi:MAG: fatty acid desaturase [Planctomycetota bacterium]
MPKAQPNVPAPHRGGLSWSNLNLKIISALAVMHLVAIMVVWPTLFSWTGLILFGVFSWLTACAGITLCYHRLLTHRSFRTPKWFEKVLTICACLAWQGGPITWVGMHRLHHKHSDTDHDPHSPQHGFSWAHILWMLQKTTDGLTPADAARDLQRDKWMVLAERYFWVPQIVLAAILLGIGWAIGGWSLGVSWVVWGVALRCIFVFHSTWFVNSAAHTWGYQNYEHTGEKSTNLWWVAILSWGEGWHNNHHAHPRSASHGLRWYEIDLTWWMIRVMSWVGLARDMNLPKPEQMPGAAKAKDAAKAKAPPAPAAPAAKPLVARPPAVS